MLQVIKASSVRGIALYSSTRTGAYSGNRAWLGTPTTGVPCRTYPLRSTLSTDFGGDCVILCHTRTLLPSFCSCSLGVGSLLWDLVRYLHTTRATSSVEDKKIKIKKKSIQYQCGVNDSTGMEYRRSTTEVRQASSYLHTIFPLFPSSLSHVSFFACVQALCFTTRTCKATVGKLRIYI